jgi:hypothetical protein
LSLYIGLIEYSYQAPRPLFIRLITFSCLESSQYSDATIRCEGREFKVHKIVVCTQSEFFSKAFNGDWKRSTGT